MPQRTALNAGARVAMVVGATVLLGFAAWSSVRISYAEFLFHQNTTASVRRAAELDPDDSRYHAWLAERLENEGQDPSAELDRAARLNPLDSRLWIRKGLTAETNGDRAGAERLLLHAASVDRLMEPRWTLMNFYFRTGEEGKFWPWAKETFAISYGDRTPLFDLCWRVRGDPGVIQSQALPAAYPVGLQFARFLVARGREVDAAVVVERILPQASPQDAQGFVTIVDRLLDRGESVRAVQLWNAIVQRGLLPFTPLDPAKGNSLTNGKFEREPSGGGFDWRIATTAGVTVLRTNTPPGMRFSFSGQQPENCDLLAQKVPLEPGRTYRLQFSYRTSGMPPGSGLQIRALDQVSPGLASEDWTHQALTFSSGANRSGDIVFEYRRPQGFVRIEGTLEVRDFTLGFAE